MTLTVTDLFCGAGGSSIGAEAAGFELRLGLNHWQRAIETHATNFPHADHDCEDVSSLTTAQIRRYPDSDILLASPECTNHSLAKGARRRKPEAPSLWEDGPAGEAEQDRSRATMWDVVRFAEQKLLRGRPYRVVIVENVTDAFRWGYNDDGGLFSAWRQAMSALGYDHQVVWLNSMFCPPTPQSRDRMYVVFWRRGQRRPDLDVHPPAWCPRCELVVDAYQAWKRPDRPWGKYGSQYLFGCPECHNAAIPAVHPAASAIDWTVGAPRIGDRKRPLAEKTRERIRRGLERLASEPFAIRLLQGGAPRPLTLPLVTLTQRHDLAIILPVAGYTHERTPGNRARHADLQPADTVHGTLDRALVMANRAHAVAKRITEAAAPTVATGGHLAIIVRQNTARGNPGQMATPAHEPFRTLTAACHQSLVVPYRDGNIPRPTSSPAPTLHTRDTLALLIPPMGQVDARDAHREPAPTQTTTTRPALVEAIADADIDDCGFRMFELHEIARTMAMSDHPHSGAYIVLGNKRERMAQYGNAVTPPAMRFLLERCLASLEAIS